MNSNQHDIPHYCKDCPKNNNETCGPWYESERLFNQVRTVHSRHPGWQEGEPSNDSFNNSMKLISDIFDNASKKTKEREKSKGKPIKQIQNYLTTRIKHDETLVQKLERCFFSAYSNDPINLGIMSPSSEGKTYATVEVAAVFPKEDVIPVGRMSPTALIHQEGTLVNSELNPIQDQLDELDFELSKNNSRKTELKKEKSALLKGVKNLIPLRGKILLFLDAPNPQLWDVLKPILSHDKYEIEFKTTQTDGSLRVKNSIIQGWPAVVFCSAKNEAHNRIWDEIETRFDITSPNSSVSKYKEANKFTALKMGTPGFAENLVSNEEDKKYAKFYVQQIKEKILDLCKNNQNPIWNPFNQIMADSFPSNEGVAMRHYKRLMEYCNIETLINSEYNYIIHFQNKSNEIEKFVITSLSDIANAIDILGTISVVPPDKLKFLNDVFEPALNDNLNGITTSKLAEKFKEVYNKNTTPKKILETYVKPLCDYGIADFTENPDDKRQHLYHISSKPQTNSLEFILDKIIEKSNIDPLFVWTGIIELEKSSIEKGKIKYITDPNGFAEGHNLIQKNIITVEEKSKNLIEVLA